MNTHDQHQHHPHRRTDRSAHPVTVTRVADDRWQALDGRLVVASGDLSHRPDGRAFVSIDAWHAPAFDRLAHEMVADLPTPLYTLVDESDTETAAGWQRVGFVRVRREWELAVPTDPQITGLDPARAPAGLTILPAGEAEEAQLRALDRAIRAEVESTLGWHAMPAEVLPRPAGVTVVDPSKYAVAVVAGEYVGFLRLAPVPRRPRIGLVAVRATHQRHGIARALLAHALDTLHRSGVPAASAEVTESNAAATALFAGIGAQRVSSNVELVLR